MAYPSTFLDIYTEVIDKVRLDATADVSRVKDWVNQVYADVCIKTEAIQDYATVTLTANQAIYTPDTSIIRVKQMYVTPTGQQQSRPLIPTSLEQILEWSAGGASTNNGYVTHYAMMGLDRIMYWPTPTAADVVTIFYVQQPTALTNNTDVPVLMEPYVSNLLVNGACYEAAVFLKDPDAVLFAQAYEKELREFRAHLRRREGAMTRQFRITRGDYHVPHDPSTDVRTL